MRALTFLVLPVMLAASIPVEAAAQVVQLRFDPANRTLALSGALPSVVPGGSLEVVVTGVASDPGWRPVLGGQDVPFISADATTGARFRMTVTPSVQVNSSGRFELTVRDPSATPVTLTGAPIQLSRAGDPIVSTNDCNVDQPVTLTRPQNDSDLIHLMFNEQGLPLRPMPTTLDENDVITVTMLLPCAEFAKFTVQLEGTLANGEMNILSSGALQNLSKVRNQLTSAGRDTFYMGTFGPFAPPQVAVVIKKDGTEIRRFVLRVLKNYIAAFRLGVGQSNIRFNDYDLRPPAGGGTANVVTNRADEDGEPRYFVSMVFYAWHFWDNGFWNGRDLAEPPGLLDRLNPYVGVGLKDPGREYLAGLTFELARGLDVVWGVHIARTEELTNGVTEGSAFTGAKADLPTRYEWETSAQFLGLSADLDAAVKVLQGILGT